VAFSSKLHDVEPQSFLEQHKSEPPGRARETEGSRVRLKAHVRDYRLTGERGYPGGAGAVAPGNSAAQLEAPNNQ
jgi:hypothetical protein